MSITIKVCSKCGAHLVRREDVMTTSYPAQYIYERPECGNVEYDIKCYNGNPTTEDSKDYKAKYEEALERARALHEEAIDKGYVLDYVKDYETIFPELAENEDERALRIIKKRMCYDPVPISDEDRRIVENWLEKQKERVPENEETGTRKEQKHDDNVSKEEYVKRFKALCDAYEIKLPNREYDIYHLCDDLSKLSIDSGEQKPIGTDFRTAVKNLMNLHKIKNKFTEEDYDFHAKELLELVEQKPDIEYKLPLDAEKQKEINDASSTIQNFFNKKQKPAEWDDYTKTNLDRAIQIIKEAKGTLQGYQSDDGIYECDKAIECLEHFLYRGLEIEKPAEWSEEDEKMIERLITRLNWITYNTRTNGTSPNITFFDEIEWLKSLRPQPQGTYKQVIHTIFGMLKDKDFYEIRPSHRVSLLNDIRVKCKDAIECAPILDEPSWKPSEEQLKALKYVAYHLMPDENYRDEMFLLYEQLKKL